MTLQQLKEEARKEPFKSILQEVWELLPDDITTNNLFYSTQIEPHIIKAIIKAYEKGKKEAYEERNKEVLEIVLSDATDVGSIYTNPNTDYVIFHGGENA